MNKATKATLQSRAQHRLELSILQAERKLNQWEETGRDIPWTLNLNLTRKEIEVRHRELVKASAHLAPKGFAPNLELTEWPQVTKDGQTRSIVKSHVRAEIIARDKTCRWCKRNKTTTIDHVIPRGRGGSNHRNNLVGSCEDCNAAKKDYVPKELGWVLHLPLRAFDPQGTVETTATEQ